MNRYEKAVAYLLDGFEIIALGCRGVECEYNEDRDEDHQCEGSFSWSSCDSCGSKLGGDRYPAFGIVRGKDPIALDICADCLFYHANGDLPENPNSEEYHVTL